MGALLPRDVLWRLAIIAVATVFTTEGWHLSGVRALAWSTGVLLVFVVAQVLLARELVPRNCAASSPDRIRGAGGPSGSAVGVNAVSVILGQIDPVVVGAMLRSEEAGHFFAAIRTASLLTLPLVAANLVAAPRSPAFITAAISPGSKNLCRSIAKATLVSTVIGLVVLLGFSNQVMAVFGARFIDMDWGLRILALGFGGQCDVRSGRHVHADDGTRAHVLLSVAGDDGPHGQASEVVGITLFGVIRRRDLERSGQTIWKMSGFASMSTAQPVSTPLSRRCFIAVCMTRPRSRPNATRPAEEGYVVSSRQAGRLRTRSTMRRGNTRRCHRRNPRRHQPQHPDHRPGRGPAPAG